MPPTVERLPGRERGELQPLSVGYEWRERPILMSAPMVVALLENRKVQTRRIMNRVKVRLRHNVSSDLPVEIGMPIVALAGTYEASLNPNGAVTVHLSEGRRLGVKPGEFDFVCPYVEGRTHLADYGGGRKGWVVTPSVASRLWVREAWAFDHTIRYDFRPIAQHDLSGRDLLTAMKYRADGEADVPRWRPGIHMPRWASRITLEVTGVRVERVASISEEDARAEGIIEWTGEHGAKHYGLTVADVWERSARGAFERLWDGINGDRATFASSPWCWVVDFKVVTP